MHRDLAQLQASINPNGICSHSAAYGMEACNGIWKCQDTFNIKWSTSIVRRTMGRIGFIMCVHWSLLVQRCAQHDIKLEGYKKNTCFQHALWYSATASKHKSKMDPFAQRCAQVDRSVQMHSLSTKLLSNKNNRISILKLTNKKNMYPTFTEISRKRKQTQIQSGLVHTALRTSQSMRNKRKRMCNQIVIQMHVTKKHVVIGHGQTYMINSSIMQSTMCWIWFIMRVHCALLARRCAQHTIKLEAHKKNACIQYAMWFRATASRRKSKVDYSAQRCAQVDRSVQTHALSTKTWSNNNNNTPIQSWSSQEKNMYPTCTVMSRKYKQTQI